MEIGNRKKTSSQEILDKSVQDEFMYFSFKDKMLEQYGLPKQPCPIRFYVLESVLAQGTIEFSLLADECIAYCQQYPEKKQDVAGLLVRLCYLAGLNADQAV